MQEPTLLLSSTKSVGDRIGLLMGSLARHPRRVLLALAAIAVGVAAASILLTTWLHLNPCYLCIVQRTLSALVALSLGVAAWNGLRTCGRLCLFLSGLLSLGGMTAAGFQSWEQWYPHEISCLASEPNILEKAVDWLGSRNPTLFMASGFCENKELEIVGLSLANWSFICFAGFALGAIFLLVRGAPPA